MNQEIKINPQSIEGISGRLAALAMELEDCHKVEVVDSKGELANKVNRLGRLCDECRQELLTVVTTIHMAIDNAKDGYVGADNYAATTMEEQYEKENRN